MGFNMGGGEQQPRSINMSSSNLVLYLSCRILPHTNCTLRALGSREWVTFSATRWLVWSSQVFSCCAAQSPWTDCREQDKTWCQKKLGPWFRSSLLTLNVKPSSPPFFPPPPLPECIYHMRQARSSVSDYCHSPAPSTCCLRVDLRMGGGGANGNCVLKRTWVRSSRNTVRSERIQQNALTARSAMTTIRLWHTDSPPIGIFWHQEWAQHS